MSASTIRKRSWQRIPVQRVPVRRIALVACLLFAATWGSRLDMVFAGVETSMPVEAAKNTPLSIPAEYLRDLRPPGHTEQFRRPGGLFYDRSSGEVLVADRGNNRVVIFDDEGLLRYSISGQDRFSNPSSIVVDSDGYIYVVGSTREGRFVFRLDYDGSFLERLTLHDREESTEPTVSADSDDPHEPDRAPDSDDSERTHPPGSLAIDAENRLYTLDQLTGRVLCFDRAGKIQRAFSIVEGIDPNSAREIVFGTLSIFRDRLYVPFSSAGTVKIFSLDGKSLGSVGTPGNVPGALNFPVAVAVTDDELVLVLDNNRFNVVCYDEEGRFLQEFGGKGQSPGWFYHPSLLAIDSRDQIYVGQIFQNKVQVCRIPASVRARRQSLREASAQRVGANLIHPRAVLPSPVDGTQQEEVVQIQPQIP